MRLFSDEAGTKEISQSDTVTPKKSNSKKNEKEGEKKDSKKDPARPKTGDDSATAAIPFVAGFVVLGSALRFKKRNIQPAGNRNQLRQSGDRHSDGRRSF